MTNMILFLIKKPQEVIFYTTPHRICCVIGLEGHSNILKALLARSEVRSTLSTLLLARGVAIEYERSRTLECINPPQINSGYKFKILSYTIENKTGMEKDEKQLLKYTN